MVAGDTAAATLFRATFDDRRVVVWQAHSHDVADHALSHGRFGGSSWRLGRVTRFRFSLPSLLARTGWGVRPGRERLLAVSLSRPGLETLLNQAVHAEYSPAVYANPMAWRLATRFANVTISWHSDVEVGGSELAQLTPRVGVRDLALQEFTEQHMVAIEDWTPWMTRFRSQPFVATVPNVAPYPLPAPLAARLAGLPVSVP